MEFTELLLNNENYYRTPIEQLFYQMAGPIKSWGNVLEVQL